MDASINRLTPTSPVLSDADFCDWLGQACAGERRAYHVGFLAPDTSSETSSLTEPDRAELVRIAGRARRATDQGLVVLAQRRLGPETFIYLAIILRRPKPKRIAITEAKANSE